MDFIDPDFLDPDTEAPKGASSLSMFDELTGSPRDSRPRPAWVRYANKGAKAAVGGLEALASLGTGALGMVQGALAIPHEKLRGNTDSGEKIYTDAIERNTYHPRTEAGQAIMKPVGEAINAVGIPMMGIGNSIPRIATRPFNRPVAPEAPAAVAEMPIQKAIREAKKESLQPKEQGTLFVDPDGVAAPQLATKITEAPEVVSLARENARKLEMEAKGLNETMFVDPDGIAMRELPKQIREEAGVIEQVKKTQAEELQATAREMELPKNEQLDLFAPEQRALAFEFGKAEEPVLPQAPTPLAPKAPPRDIPKIEVKDRDGNPYNVSVTKQTFGVNETKPNSVMVEIRDPVSGERRGMVDFAIREDGVLVAENAKVAPAFKGKGIAEQMYLATREAGYDIAPGRVQTDAGSGMVSSLQRKGIINKEADGARFKAGDLDLVPIEGEVLPGEKFYPSSTTLSGPMEVLPMAERPLPVDTIKAPSSPEMLAAKATEQKKVQVLAKVLPESVMKEWLDVNTRQEALHLGKDAKDIGPLSGVREMGSGIQGVTITSGNNPVLKYARKVFGDARADVAKFSQEYITKSDTGLVTRIQDLAPKEKVAVMDALLEGDKQQHRFTRETMEKMGFNERQQAFIEQFQKTADAIFDKWNTARADLGFKPVAYREGWFPGIFKGGYKTLVTNGKGDIVGMVATDTKWQQKAARDWYSKKFPDAQFSSTQRSGLGKTKVDFFSGLNDVLAILAKGDPKMAELLAKSQEAQKTANNNLFSVGAHELQKKGIVGNQGNKPWLSKERNAKEALEAMIDYFEQAAEHHALQKPLHEIDSLVKSAELDHMPNVKGYLQKYADHVTGKTGDLGAALNQAIDIPFKAAGISSSIPLKAANTIKAGMSRMFMGYINPAFMASQLAQPFQLAYPLASAFAERLGIPQHMVMNTMGRGSVYATSETIATMLKNDKLSIAPPHIKAAIKYAHDRGLYAFNELEAAQGATKNKYVRAHNALADFSISAGDRMTKLPTYLGFVEMFTEAGMELPVALRVAEKATETSMVNYHPWERPMIYNKLGALGQFAGGLTTYKHGSLNALTKLAQEKGNKKPIALAAMSMLVFSGITGMVAYQELDALYSKLSEYTKGKPSTIREDFLQNMPEYLKSGVVSTATNLNMQAKWSAADMVPDSLGKAASPHLEGAYQIAAAAAEYASDPSVVNRNNLLMKLTPSGLKGFTEEAVMKDEQGRVLGKEGLPRFSEPRSAEDWDKRKYTGVGLLSESIKSQDTYKDRIAQMYKDKQIGDLTKKVKAAFIGKEFARMTKLIEKHRELAGPEATQALLQSLGSKTNLDTQKGEKERLQGTPSNRKGVEKYQEFNDGT
jgi:hypothetical protein